MLLHGTHDTGGEAQRRMKAPGAYHSGGPAGRKRQESLSANTSLMGVLKDSLTLSESGTRPT